MDVLVDQNTRRSKGTWDMGGVLFWWMLDIDIFNCDNPVLQS